MSEKRFTVTLDAYIWAENEEEMKKEALRLKKQLQGNDDNQAAILTIHETPFASLSAKLVHEGNILE